MCTFSTHFPSESRKLFALLPLGSAVSTRERKETKKVVIKAYSTLQNPRTGAAGCYRLLMKNDIYQYIIPELFLRGWAKKTLGA